MDVLIVDDEALARNELKYLLNQCEGVSLIIEASTIQEALEILLTESIDLAFLDIQLTNESGLDLADKIAKMPHPPEFVFATAYDEYAIEAFEKMLETIF
ncbi:response regulator [Tetragenococcus koreensis]|uniref:response regulator n=1 Tax=Tetragenococcus koreensis TaxID=290335 RepID=UPI002E16D8AF